MDRESEREPNTARSMDTEREIEIQLDKWTHRERLL